MRKSALTLLTSLTFVGASAPLVVLAQPAPADQPPAAPPAPAAGEAPAAGPAPAGAPAAPAAAQAEPAPAAAPGEPAPAPAAGPPPPAAPAAGPEAEKPKAPPPEVTGYVEGAYHVNLTHAATNLPVPTRSYDYWGGNSFILHAAHVAINHKFSDMVKGTIEIDAGHDAGMTNGLVPLINAGNTGPAIDPLFFNIQEAYATLTSDFGLYFIAGKFVTYEGIEVIEGPLDPTITRGFLFGLAEPYAHVGAKLHYAIGDKADIGVGVVNGWDVWIDNNDAKTLIWRIGVTPVDMFWAALSGYYGAERTKFSDPGANRDGRLSIDLTGAVKVGDMLAINFQFNYGSEKNAVPGPLPTDPRKNASWLGFGLQPVVTYQAFSAGLRLEWFNDADGARNGITPGDPTAVPPITTTATPAKYTNITITPGYTFGEKFTLRAEYRHDFSTQPNLTDGKKGQDTIAIGAHYIF